MEAPGHTDPFDLVGTVLERKYRVDAVVAEGGFGIVYAGHHLALDLPVAVKVLKRRPEMDNDAWQDLLARFVQEAQTMAKLRHPNVVSVLDTGVAQIGDGPLPWMVLEWLAGVTLKDDLAARRGKGGRSTREALDLMRPVVLAVAEAHQARIAHRDLKPSNVMLVPGRRGDVTARVLDFGIAKVMGHEAHAASGHTTTDDAFRAFSLGYAAPEQIAGARTGPWTDVHALGLMLTEVLVDVAPYSEEPTEQHARAFDAVRPTPAKFGVDVGALEGVIARAVALKPAARYGDAGALLAALEEAAPERVSAVPVVRDDRAGATTGGTPRPPRRALATWWVVGGVAVAAAGVAVTVAGFGGDHARGVEPSATPSAPASVTLPSAPPSASGPTAPSSTASVALVPQPPASATTRVVPRPPVPPPAASRSLASAHPSPPPPPALTNTAATSTASQSRPQYVPE